MLYMYILGVKLYGYLKLKTKNILKLKFDSTKKCDLKKSKHQLYSQCS